MSVHLDLQSLVVALAALVRILTPILVLRLQGKVGQVHSLVNGQNTAQQAEIASLKAQVAVLTAQAVAATAAGKSSLAGDVKP